MSINEPYARKGFVNVLVHNQGVRTLLSSFLCVVAQNAAKGASLFARYIGSAC